MSELFRKIDLRDVFWGHLNTMVDDRTKRTSGWDIALFYGFPTAAVAALLALGIGLSDNAINILTNALAILGGLLFNLLVLLQTLSGPDEAHPVKHAVRELARQIYNNIAYAILVSLVALAPLMIAANYDEQTRFGRVLASSIAIWLVTHFVLTMCMVLKRMHVMLQEEFSRNR